METRTIFQYNPIKEPISVPLRNVYVHLDDTLSHRDILKHLNGIGDIPKKEQLSILEDKPPIIQPEYKQTTFSTRINKGAITTQSSHKPLKDVNITGDSIQTKTNTFDIDEYRRMLLTKQQPKILKASEYILNNRQIFPRFIQSLFKPYIQELETTTSREHYELLPQQKIIRDYLSIHTPYRGLLVFHGLGSGKTCASIGVAEALKSYKEIIVMTPAFLRSNFIKELKQCGDYLFRLNQHWKFYSLHSKKDDDKLLNELIRVFPLTKNYIKKQNGIWLSHYHKQPNYDVLTDVEKQSLNQQIDEMIRSKYQFVNYNGITDKKYQEWTKDGTYNPFNNKVIIIDETHNFISRIVNSIQQDKNSISRSMYEFLKSATNCKLVFLTGTPIVNYPNEMGVLFNMLRGYIKMHTFYLNKPSDERTIERILEPILDIDYVEYKPSSNQINIIRNPYGFYKVYDDIQTKVASRTTRKKRVRFKQGGGRKKTRGVKRYTKHFVEQDEFIGRVINKLKDNDIYIEGKVVDTVYDALPDDLETFTNLYIRDTKEGHLKNTNALKRRILGLTSYFRSSIDEYLPKKHPNNIVRIPFDEYQFNEYLKIRNEEVRKQKLKERMNRKSGLYSDTQGTYRIYSRLYCNFVFPRTIVRPQPKDDSDDKDYQERIQEAINNIVHHEDQYLDIEHIQEYSPKMYRILNHLKEHTGCQLLYSQFRSIEGIELMKQVLLMNGYEEFKIKKNEHNEWILNMNSYDKPTFVLHTGKEDSETKDIVRNIFNSVWDKVPDSLIRGMKEMMNINMNKKNMYGDIIQMIMITSSGSEGIDLKNVQYVHILEPYWHPVRTEQVIGRAVRLKSHMDLPKELREVHVYIYLMTFTDEQKERLSRDIRRVDHSRKDKNIYLTADEILWEISTIKENINKELIKTIKESSMDCLLFQKQNTNEGLQCFVFDTNDTDKRAYHTHYEQEQTDQVEELNYDKVERDLKVVRDTFLIDMNTNEVFDYKEYKASKSLIQVGTFNPKQRKITRLKKK